MSIESIIKKSTEISRQLEKRAYIVDKDNCFPRENVDLLKSEGFMKLFIPAKFGGGGYGLKEFLEITRIMAQGCLSTAVIWSMHFQQVMVLIHHLQENVKAKILTNIAENNLYVGSVTTEIGKGGTLLKCNAPLKYDENSVILERVAPIVTGGDQCDAYLITMKKKTDATENEVVLVYAEKKNLDVELISQPNMLGMRGTYTTGIKISGKLQSGCIVNPSQKFNELCISTMIPMGHLAWASCWIGCAEYAYKLVRDENFRNPKTRNQFNSDHAYQKLARVRMDIDIVDSYLQMVGTLYLTNRDSLGYLSSNEFQIKINNLKILSSEILYKCVNDLIEIVGLRYGYINAKDTPLERILRDLRSASLMFHNQRLMDINGKLVLFEKY